MMIDTEEVKRYIKTQEDALKVTDRLFPVNNVFNDGVLQGLNLVKTFLLVYEGKEGTAIAQNYKED